MFKINRKLEYALIALKHMDVKGDRGLTSAKEVCTLYHTPFDPTSRVLQVMAQNALLRAEQGAHGGYSILKDLSTVTMKELTDMIIGPIRIANCLSGNYSSCDMVASCSVISPMLNLNERIAEMFQEISVKELLQSKNAEEKFIRQKPVNKTAA